VRVASVSIAAVASGNASGPANGVAHMPTRRRPPKNARISVVIPAMNEARNLPYVLGMLPEGIFEVVLVDGHSTDDTVRIARECYPAVTIVGQAGRGKGNALATGFGQATGDIIVAMDADGSMDPAELRRLVKPLLDGADFVKGSRFTAGGGSDDITVVRRLGNAVLCRLVNILFGTQYTDLCYGYFAFWRDCLSALRTDCDGFEVETLIAIRAAHAHLSVSEVPSFERSRIHGSSNLRVGRDGIRIARVIVRERLRHKRTLITTHELPAEISA
jgi:glycosyltransferase involved in cell wall biosynthesis